MSRSYHCRVFSEPTSGAEKAFHATMRVEAFFAGSRIVAFETDSQHPLAKLTVSDLLRQWKGKYAPQGGTLYAEVPHSYVVKLREMQQRDLPLELKLEVGKFYRRRDGQVVGPMGASQQGVNELYPFTCSSLSSDRELFLSYAPNGRYFARSCKDSPIDLIAEVAAPVTQPEVEKATGVAFAPKVSVDLPDQYFKPTVSPADPLKEISSLEKQEGGNHYKSLKIQPIEYIHANSIPFAEGSVIKYVTRWRSKNGIADLKKARHFIDLLIELEERAE